MLGQHLEEVVARDVFVEVDAAGVDLNAFACPWWSLSAGVVDLAIDLEQAVVLGACRVGGVDGGKIGDEVRAKCRKTTLEPLVQQLKQRFAAVQSTVEKL